MVSKRGCLIITLVPSPHSVYLLSGRDSYRPCGCVACEDCKNPETCQSLACTASVLQ